MKNNELIKGFVVFLFILIFVLGVRAMEAVEDTADDFGDSGPVNSENNVAEEVADLKAVEEGILYIDLDQINEADIDDSLEVIPESLEFIEEPMDENYSEEDLDVWFDSENETNETPEEILYVNLEEILDSTNEEMPQETDQTTENEEIQKIEKTLVKDGEIELEFLVYEGEEIEILKKELLEEENEKVIIISSEEHFNDEIRAYSDLPFPAERQQIIITWENENEIISPNQIEYIDENEDDLIERVSWIVPHLSTQTYRIHIQVNGSSSSPTLSLSVVDPFDDNGTILTNPANLSFNIDYVNISNIECRVNVSGTLSSLFNYTENITLSPLTLSNGINLWAIYCEDVTNTSIYKSLVGNFLVQNSLSVAPQTSGKNLYLLGDGFVVNVLANGGVTELKLYGPNGILYTFSNVSGINNPVSVPSSLLSSVGNYTINATNYYFESPVKYSYNFSVGRINVSFDNLVEEDETVKFNVSLNGVSNVYFDLYVGNILVENNYNILSGNSILNDSFGEGDYDVELRDIQIGSFNYGNRDFGDLEVVSSGDDESPEIDLIYPDWEDTISSDTITFVYSASDDVDLVNCSLEISNTTKSSSGVYKEEELLFPLTSSDKNLALEKNPTNDQEIELKLVDFDEGSYLWEVRCFDSSGNDGWDYNYFEVYYDSQSTKSFGSGSGNEYDRQEEVNDLIEKINVYLEDQKTFTLEERAVEAALEISEDMNSYKKRLLQFDQDLRYNLNFMEESKREERIAEINKEIDEIGEGVVVRLEVTDTYEYQKSSPDASFEGVLLDYLDLTGTEVGRGSFKNLLTFNEELQGVLELKAQIWNVEIEYLDDTKEIVLVEKSLDFFSEFNGEILEFVPEEVGKPIFLTPVQLIGGGIYELNFEDLDLGKLIYYIEDDMDLEDLEKTETFLFDEGAPERSALTGFFSFTDVGSGGFSWITIILVLLVLGFLMVLMFKKYQFENYKKVPGVTALIELMNETKKQLDLDRVDSARENYESMKEIYRALPANCQEIFYDNVNKIRVAINKKDVISLVVEYEKAKDEFRKEDAEQIYLKINSLYKKLPKKFQEKVYRRLVKKEIV